MISVWPHWQEQGIYAITRTGRIFIQTHTRFQILINFILENNKNKYDDKYIHISLIEAHCGFKHNWHWVHRTCGIIIHPFSSSSRIIFAAFLYIDNNIIAVKEPNHCCRLAGRICSQNHSCVFQTYLLIIVDTDQDYWRHTSDGCNEIKCKMHISIQLQLK